MGIVTGGWLRVGVCLAIPPATGIAVGIPGHGFVDSPVVIVDCGRLHHDC